MLDLIEYMALTSDDGWGGLPGTFASFSLPCTMTLFCILKLVIFLKSILRLDLRLSLSLGVVRELKAADAPVVHFLSRMA